VKSTDREGGSVDVVEVVGTRREMKNTDEGLGDYHMPDWTETGESTGHGFTVTNNVLEFTLNTTGTPSPVETGVGRGAEGSSRQSCSGRGRVLTGNETEHHTSPGRGNVLKELSSNLVESPLKKVIHCTRFLRFYVSA